LNASLPAEVLDTGENLKRRSAQLGPPLFAWPKYRTVSHSNRWAQFFSPRRLVGSWR